MASLASLTPPIALGALDGRYRGAVADLVDHLSEPALNRERTRVEIEWLIHLTDAQVVPGVRALTEDEKGRLRAIVDDFGADDIAEMKETERVAPGPGPGRGPFGGPMVGQRSMEFGPSARRLLRRMRPDRLKAGAVVGLAVVSVALTVAGPRILGAATDRVFAGFIGKSLPAGTTRTQVADQLRARGEDTFADMVAAMDHLVPGEGVDFGAVAT